jgi:hypothetical protein
MPREAVAVVREVQGVEAVDRAVVETSTPVTESVRPRELSSRESPSRVRSKSPKPDIGELVLGEATKHLSVRIPATLDDELFLATVKAKRGGDDANASKQEVVINALRDYLTRLNAA